MISMYNNHNKQIHTLNFPSCNLELDVDGFHEKRWREYWDLLALKATCGHCECGALP